MNWDSQDWFKSTSTISTTLTWAHMISLTFLLSMRKSQFIHPPSLHSMLQVTCLALAAWSMNAFILFAVGEKVLAISTHYSSMLLVTMWKVMMSQHPIMGSLVLRLPEHIFSFHSLTMGWNTHVCWYTGSLMWEICPVTSLGCILLSQIIFLPVSLSQPWFILTLSSEPHTSCLFSLITPLCQGINIMSRHLIPFLSSTSTDILIIMPTR